MNNGSLAEVTSSNCRLHFLNLTDRHKKVKPVFPCFHTSHEVWLKLGGNWWSGSLLKILSKICKVHWKAPNWTQRIGLTLHMQFLGLNFLPFRYTLNHVQDIAHFRKFQSATNWPIGKKRKSLYSTTVANVLRKFGWDRMKSVGVAVWNFSSLIWSCANKKFKPSIFFVHLADCQER